MYSSITLTLENLLVYNKEYSLGVPNTGSFQVTLSCDTDEPFDLNKLLELKDLINSSFNGKIVIQNNDPYLIHLIEPKSGTTVHNLLNSLREEDYRFRKLGFTFPPDTRNGYKVYVLNVKYYTSTMEGLAKFILNEFNTTLNGTLLIDKVTVKNLISGLEVTVVK